MTELASRMDKGNELTLDNFKDGKGRIQWSVLRKQPELLHTLLEKEAAIFVAEGNKLTFKNLLKAKRANIADAIRRFYPGGLYGLEGYLDLTTRRKHRDGKTMRSPEMIEKIRNDAYDFFQTHGAISNAVLTNVGREELYTDIQAYYPGKMRRLQRELNTQGRQTISRTPEQIKQEALIFYQQHGVLTTPSLTSLGNRDLRAAIQRKYPGKIYQLRQDLGIDEGQKPHRYWSDIENIRKEAHEFYQREAVFSQRGLITRGRSDIWSAAVRYYPGGFRQLKSDLDSVSEPFSSDRISTEDADEALGRLIK